VSNERVGLARQGGNLQRPHLMGHRSTVGPTGIGPNTVICRLARVVDRYGAIHPSNIAGLYATRGDADLAFRWLERAYQQHDEGLIPGPPFVLDPAWIPLRADPRYKAFLRKMKLPV
jgi:hypothetical protein